ncbi:MAG: hypothetical protein Ct9H300mP23_07630 [Nitrospinota bacterium]|nr:MAG: hypothetical protein Ct9H300mP23_07630 [Nitrospinota bacterium]
MKRSVTVEEIKIGITIPFSHGCLFGGCTTLDNSFDVKDFITGTPFLKNTAKRELISQVAVL